MSRGGREKRAGGSMIFSFSQESQSEPHLPRTRTQNPNLGQGRSRTLKNQSTMATSSTPLIGVAAVAEDELSLFAAACAAADVAVNWRWILTVGILNVAAGILCLISPIVASLVAESILAWTILFIGVLNLTGLFFAEKGVRPYYGIFGLLQIGAGVFIIKNPYETLFALTVWIAIMVLLDGLYHCALCCGNRNLCGWGFTLASGLASVMLGVLMLTGLPESSLYMIGILLGVDMIMVGNIRINVALEGKAVAEE